MAKKYKLGFDIGALLLFVAVMIPNFIWSALPAPNDILRAESVTKTIDAIASVCQALMLAALCFIQDRERKKLSVSPLLIATGLCCLLYYISWLAYYRGLAGAIVILGLSVPPCMAFILYAIDRKNWVAVIPALGFTIGHIIYAMVNFIA
ncbi:MAG: hypothetical protein ACOX6G_10475 [Christensenellales bacterium]|jgi:hypothetical protein|nr:hypothetical protein [Clostridiales bacterium]